MVGGGGQTAAAVAIRPELRTVPAAASNKLPSYAGSIGEAHLDQEQSPPTIAVQLAQQRLKLDMAQGWVTRGVRALQPFEGQIDIAAVSVSLRVQEGVLREFGELPERR